MRKNPRRGRFSVCSGDGYDVFFAVMVCKRDKILLNFQRNNPRKRSSGAIHQVKPVIYGFCSQKSRVKAYFFENIHEIIIHDNCFVKNVVPTAKY